MSGSVWFGSVTKLEYSSYSKLEYSKFITEPNHRHKPVRLMIENIGLVDEVAKRAALATYVCFDSLISLLVPKSGYDFDLCWFCLVWFYCELGIFQVGISSQLDYI